MRTQTNLNGSGSTNMIRAEHLTKRYGPTVAVDDISFTVRPGRVTGFLGPNGAGKSTTIRMILGLDTPTAGAVTINGLPFDSPGSLIGSLFLMVLGIVILALLMHAARWIARGHARLAKLLLVEPNAP